MADRPGPPVGCRLTIGRLMLLIAASSLPIGMVAWLRRMLRPGNEPSWLALLVLPPLIVFGAVAAYAAACFGLVFLLVRLKQRQIERDRQPGRSPSCAPAAPSSGACGGAGRQSLASSATAR